MTTINMPAHFPGTAAEVQANYRTHAFNYWGDDARCTECDCRPGGVVAEWPCGANVPRQVVTVPAPVR